MSNPEPDHRKAELITDEGSSQGDLQDLIKHVKDNPLLYALGTITIIAVAAFSATYNVYQYTNQRAEVSSLSRAIDEEDATIKIQSLDAIAQSNSSVAAEALYLKGETAFANGEYDVAAQSFTQLRESHPTFQFTPDAVEGLGSIEEERENYSNAIAFYQEVQSTWPNTYAAARQHFNIARSHIGAGDFEASFDSYKEQIREFPGSIVAGRAQHRIHQLIADHPELAPAELIDIDSAVEVDHTGHAHAINDAAALAAETPESAESDEEASTEE